MSTPGTARRAWAQNRQNRPAAMLVCVDTPLPENVRKPVSAGPVRVELPTTVTPWFVTGRVELLNMIVVGARKRKRPAGSPPSTTLGVASRAVPAVFLLRETRASSRIPQRGETWYLTRSEER